jgi:regulator of cell morphogenesis and NO signaling
MKPIDAMTLKEIVSEDFRSASVFEHYSLDFCCRGARTLQEACGEKGLPVGQVLSALASIDRGNRHEAEQLPLDELVRYIVERHHGYVASAIPAIHRHAGKVASVHGGRHPEMVEVFGEFERVAQELEHHMAKEERILFPVIRTLTDSPANDGAAAGSPFNSIVYPIRVMEAEHAGAGDALARIRSLTGTYSPPEDACTTFRVLLQELEEFEKDLHIHVHLENNVLFPRAIAAENARIQIIPS